MSYWRISSLALIVGTMRVFLLNNAERVDMGADFAP